MPQTTIQFTIASMGTGKTYSRGPRFILDEWLPFHDGPHISNLPLFPNKIGVEAAKRHGGEWSEYAERIRLIPDEVVQQWWDGKSGPWDYFGSRDLEAAHVFLDEAQHFLGPGSELKKTREKWLAWLTEIRHWGASIEFATQTESLLDPTALKLAEKRIKLSSGDLRRDPFCGVPYYDWRQLLTGTFGVPIPRQVIEIEEQKELSRWKEAENGRRVFTFQPRLFELYDSHSASKLGAGKGKAEEEEHKRLGLIRLWRWFGARNFWRVSVRLVIAAGIVLICLNLGRIWTTFSTTIAGAVASRVTDTSVKMQDGREASAQLREGAGGDSSADEGAGSEESAGNEAEVEAVRSELAAERELRRAAEAEAAEAEAESAELRETLRASSEVVAMTDERVMVQDGTIYEVGERIRRGPWSGAEIVSFERQSGMVELGTGETLEFGQR